MLKIQNAAVNQFFNSLLFFLLHDDIVFVDKELTVEPGDTVLFIKDGKEMAGVLEEQNGEFLLVVGDKKFNKYDCEYAAVVIMFIRRLSYR